MNYLREHTNTRWRTTNTQHTCSVVVDILCYPTGDLIEIYVSTTKHRKSINYTAQMRLSSVLPYLAKKPHSVSTIRLRVKQIKEMTGRGTTRRATLERQGLKRIDTYEARLKTNASKLNLKIIEDFGNN